MDTIEMQAKTRTAKGDGPARTLRREGRLPAVLYGPNTEPILLSVGTKDLEDAMKSGSAERSILTLVIDDGKDSKPAMIKELQVHPVSGKMLHADFYEVDMTQKIKISVPVATTGKAKGVELGGMLQIIRRELEVLCLPNEIPDAITIDITDLDVGESLHVQEITPEGGVEIPSDVNFTVLTILSPKVEEEEVEEEEGEEVEGAEEEAPAEEAAEE